MSYNKDIDDSILESIKSLSLQESQLWKCDTCTFLNIPTSTVCKMCLQSKPESKPTPRRNPPSERKEGESLKSYYKSKPDYIGSIDKYLNENNLQYLYTRGDGFCSIYAVYQSYLSINNNEFLLNKMGFEITSPSDWSLFVTSYINENKRKFKEIQMYDYEVDDLIIALSKNDSIIDSNIIFYILSQKYP